MWTCGYCGKLNETSVSICKYCEKPFGAPLSDNESPATTGNNDYTAVLRSEIEKWDVDKQLFLHVTEVTDLATRLNSVVKAQQNFA